MRDLEEHGRRVLACARCFSAGRNAPVVDTAKRARVLLVARAPGLTEAKERAPFTGPAGRRLGGWFCKAGVEREEICLSALARCFPGKAPGGGDRVPTRAMIANCRPHLLREFEILAPEIVVLVGGLAVKELLGTTRLSEAVGETFWRDGVVYVPLPHPSGASTWPIAPENGERLARSLRILGGLVAAKRSGGAHV